MNDLLLTGTFVAQSNYKGSSKFDFWRDIRPGDILEITMEIKNPGRGRQPYAPQLHVHRNDDCYFKCSLVELTNYLSKIDLLGA
jgi:hypothetical protein